MPPDLYGEALERFSRLWNRAQGLGQKEPSAMTLSTADKKGRPSSRTVLLKSYDRRGFVFYTNLQSRKGAQLVENPRASLCFYFDRLRTQVIVEGRSELVSPAEADAYWKTRGRLKQLGAWASLQSRPLKNRAHFLLRIAGYAARFAGRMPPRPPHWTGLRIVPERIEFWSGRAQRLNERLLYSSRDGRWRKGLLFP